MGILSVQSVSKIYPKRWRQPAVEALQNVSFELGPGQIMGLLGPNGAGKTTLIKCALGLMRPDQGNIHVLDVVSTLAAARAHVGYLPENHAFPDYLNAEQVLHFVGRLFGWPRPQRRARIEQLLTQLGLGKRLKTKLKAYSKGMKQRLGLAQALFNQPQLLVLDEPNEGLDPLGRADVKVLLHELKDQGLSVLISSHVLAEVEAVCDRVAILNEGRLLCEGTLEELTQGRGLEAAFVALVRAQPGSDSSGEPR